MNNRTGKNIWFLLVLVLFAPVGADAFWSLYKWDYHSDITKNAFSFITVESPDPDLLEIRFSEYAKDRISWWNKQADYPAIYVPEMHFDNEQLEQSFDRLVRMRSQLIEELRMPSANLEYHWEQLGFMLHAVQDFYSHSTIVNVPAIISFGDATLRNEMPAALVVDTRDVCSDAEGTTPIDARMTTGWYLYGNIQSFNPGRCRHGSTVYHAARLLSDCGRDHPDNAHLMMNQGINQDYHCQPRHRLAKQLALQSSIELIASIVNQLRLRDDVNPPNPSGLCRLMGLPEPQCYGPPEIESVTPMEIVAPPDPPGYGGTFVVAGRNFLPGMGMRLQSDAPVALVGDVFISEDRTEIHHDFDIGCCEATNNWLNRTFTLSVGYLNDVEVSADILIVDTTAPVIDSISPSEIVAPDTVEGYIGTFVISGRNFQDGFMRFKDAAPLAWISDVTVNSEGTQIQRDFEIGCCEPLNNWLNRTFTIEVVTPEGIAEVTVLIIPP